MDAALLLNPPIASCFFVSSQKCRTFCGWGLDNWFVYFFTTGSCREMHTTLFRRAAQVPHADRSHDSVQPLFRVPRMICAISKNTTRGQPYMQRDSKCWRCSSGMGIGVDVGYVYVDRSLRLQRRQARHSFRLSSWLFVRERLRASSPWAYMVMLSSPPPVLLGGRRGQADGPHVHGIPRVRRFHGRRRRGLLHVGQGNYNTG